MLELIWRFDTRVLADEAIMMPLLAAIAQTPGLSPRRYDLNQKEQWRDFDADHALVDALTQRTQLMRIQGEDQGALAMIAMGKRDEQPTAILRLPDEDRVDALVGRWTTLYEELPIESTLISSSQWRAALESAELPPGAVGGLLGMIFGWKRGAEPAGVARLEADVLADTPVRIEREANHLVLRLADEARIENEAHRRALEHVSRRLLQP